VHGKVELKGKLICKNLKIVAGVLCQNYFLFAFLLMLAYIYGKEGNWPLVFRYPNIWTKVVNDY
jgi:hypothetical protein